MRYHCVAHPLKAFTERATSIARSYISENAEVVCPPRDISYSAFRKWVQTIEDSPSSRPKSTEAKPGRPRLEESISDAIVRIRKETGWGYTGSNLLPVVCEVSLCKTSDQLRLALAFASSEVSHAQRTETEDSHRSRLGNCRWRSGVCPKRNLQGW